MRKLKLLLATCALLGGVIPANAQTDVTSTYITNADFEGTYTNKISNSSGSNLRYVREPNGWALDYSNGCEWDASILSKDDELYNSIKTKITIPGDGRGDQTYAVRLHGNANNSQITLVKSTQTFPKGKYTLTGSFFTQNQNELEVGFFFGSYSTETRVKYTGGNDAWRTLSTTFESDGTTQKAIGVFFKHNSGNAMIAGADNITLSYENVNGNILAALIAQANSINAQTNDLSDAITTAQGVYVGINNTPDYQDDIDDAISTLKSAIATSVSGISLSHRLDLSYLIANAGFEGITAEIANYGTAKGKDYSTDGWILDTTCDSGQGAVLTYGSNLTLNSAQIPATDNEEGTGKALGISVGWGGTQLYKTAPITLPAGKYIIKVHGYNAGTSKTFNLMFGFSPISGAASLSTKTSYEINTWEEEEVSFTLSSDTEGCFQLGGVAVSGSGSGSTAKVFFDNISLTYVTEVGLAKEVWDVAKTAAQAARDHADYSNVTGSEKTNLLAEIAKAEPTTAEAYGTATTALQEATSAFTAAKDSYDALVAARTDATTNYTTALWPRASADKKTALDNAVAAVPANAADAVTKTNAIVTAIRQFVESNGLAEGVDVAVDKTSLLLVSDASVSTSGWTSGSIGTNSGEGYTDGGGNVASLYFNGGWSANAGVNITLTQELTLPAGQYQLQITARGATALTSYTMSVGETSVDLPKDGSTGGTFGRGWSDKFIVFTSDGSTQTLTIAATSTDNYQWISFNRLHLTKLDATLATVEDYAALNAAIAAAEAKTLGFEDGEYAPYNNVTALTKLAEAKAINPSANNDQSIVQALTTYLNTAANWTANESEVNAIWDSSFEHEYSTSGNVQPIAWKGTSGHDNATDVRWMWNVSSNAGLAATSSSKALFTKYGAFYGQEDGYTLPLNEETYYTVSFKYGGWDDCKKDGYVTMSDPSSTSLSLIPSDRLPLDAVDGNSNTASWKNYQAFFKTNAAGNYVLGLRKDNENQQSQYVYGDFVLKQTTIAEATTYYNSVKTAVEGDYDADANGGSEKTAFKTAIDADVSAYTVAQLMEAAASLYTLRDAFVAATPTYDKYAEECARAIELGVTSGDIAALTVASDYQTKLQALIVQEDEAVRTGYPVNVTGLLGTANTQNTEVGQGQHWYGPSYSYYNKYKNEGFTMSVKHTVTLPAGSYVYKGAARCNKVNEKEQYYIGVTQNGTLKKELFTSYNGLTGKGIDNEGHANYGDGDFVNEGNGYGWEWRFVGFTLEEPTEVELKITANILEGGWVSFADMCLLSQGLTITEDAEDTKINVTNPINVTLDRAFNAGWNAVCLPFATTKASLASNAEIYKFTGESGTEDVTLNFESATSFEANTPYLVYLSAAVEGGKVFNGVNYDPAEAKTTGTAFDFMGVYAVTNIAEGSWVISGGALKKASAAIDLKPTRAYFAPKASTARIAGFTIDGDEATGLKAVMAEQGLPVDGIYNLKGQKVSGQLKKGIYVVNGKKIVK